MVCIYYKTCCTNDVVTWRVYCPYSCKQATFYYQWS